MSSPDLGKLLSQAREVQTRLAEVQRELQQRQVEGQAGGGMVRAVVNGGLQVVSLEIEPSLLAGGDRAMLQDLCAAAVNAALARAQEMVQQELQRASLQFANPGS